MLIKVKFYVVGIGLNLYKKEETIFKNFIGKDDENLLFKKKLLFYEML